MGKQRERERDLSSLTVFIHISDMLEPLWLGVFVFSNQQKTDDNIWCLAEGGNFCMRTFLQGPVHCGLP